MIGQTISHYEILSKLGGGGMGVVYKANDTRLKRTVALKFLPPELTRSSEANDRFIHEAQAASALDHPNICTVYDIGETEGQELFIVMAFYEGETLERKVERSPLRLEEAIDTALQIAQGLAEAHKHGIVHRDIKSANIMITTEGVVKIVDFGLAKLSGKTKLTRTGSTLGTVGYMSPEQLRGDEADQRADIFSFGVVLYEMLTGHLPFRGDHVAAVTYAIANEPPIPIHTYVPDVSSELVHIIARALEKDPSDRYQGFADVIIDLRRLRKETTEVTLGLHPDGKTNLFMKGRLIVIGSGLLLVVIVAIFFFVPHARKMPRLNPNSTTHVLPLAVKNVKYCALSPDGNWIAFAGSDESGTWDVYFMNASGSAVRRVTHDSSQYMTSARNISHDGAWILYSRTRRGTSRGTSRVRVNEIALVRSLGGKGQVVCGGDMPRFGSNDETIWYLKGWSTSPSESGKYEVWSVKPDGTDNHLVFTDPGYAKAIPGDGLSTSHSPSPDGESIAWILSDSTFAQNVVTFNLHSRETRQVTFGSGAIDELNWTQNDYIIYSQYTRGSGNYDLWMCSPEGGEPMQLTRSPVADEIYGTLSADGRMLLYYQVGVSGNIRIMNLKTGEVSEVTSDDLTRVDVCISPDNRYVAYTPTASYPTYLTRWGIQIVDRIGEESSRHILADENIFWTSKSWSPDGKYIAYTRGPKHAGENEKICIVSAFGRPAAQYIADIHPSATHAGPRPRWRDGHTLCWFDDMKTWVSSVENPNPQQFFEDSTNAFSFGQKEYVLLRDYRKGREGWWIDWPLSPRNAERRPRKKLCDPIDRYLVAPDGGFLILWLPSRELLKIDLPGGRKQRLPYPARGQVWDNISQDGESVVYVEYETVSKLIMWEDPFVWD